MSIPFDITQKEIEKDLLVAQNGGFMLGELIHIIMFCDDIETVIKMRFTSKHVYSAIRKMKTNPYYSVKKLDKSIPLKQRIVNARKDVLVFRNMMCYKCQVETLETIRLKKLNQYESFNIINDCPVVDNNNFEVLRPKVTDLTLVIHSDLNIDLSGLVSLRTLRLNFGTTDISLVINGLKTGFHELNKFSQFKNIYIKTSGKHSSKLGECLTHLDSTNKNIVIRFDKITESEYEKFLVYNINATLIVVRNDLNSSIKAKSVQLIPNSDNIYYLSTSLLGNQKFMTDFMNDNYPTHLFVSGLSQNYSNPIDMSFCTCLSTLSLNEAYFSKKCSMLLPTTLTELNLVNIDSIDFPQLADINFGSLSFTSCNSFSSITIPHTVTSLTIDKCIQLSSIEGLSDSILKKLKIIMIVGQLIHLLDSKKTPLINLWLKYCISLTSIILPSSLQILSVNNCEKLTEVVNLDKIDLLSFQTSGFFNVPDLILPQSLTYFDLKDYESTQTTTLFNLQELLKLKEMFITNAQFLNTLTFPTNLSALYLRGCKNLTYYPNLMDLELQVLEISSCDALTYLSFPVSLTKMIITQCHQLMDIPNLDEMSNLKSLELASCASLESLWFPTSLSTLQLLKCKNLNELPNIHELNIPFNELLPFYYNLKNPLIPTTLTEICVEAWECLTLPNLHLIPMKDLRILNCSTLSTIKCPSTVTFLEVSGCKCISRIHHLNKLRIQILKICYCSSIKSLKIPTTVTKLVMYDNKNLTLPNTRKVSIKYMYLECMENIKTVGIPSTLTKLEVKECDLVTSFPGLSDSGIIDLHLFHCKAVKSLTLPTTTTKLILDSFKQMTSLNELDKLKIETLKLSGMKQMKKFKFPTTLTKLELSSCLHLKKLSNLNSLCIEELTLYLLDSLKTIDFPTTLTCLRIDNCRQFTVSSLTELGALCSLEFILCPKFTKVELPLGLQSLSVSDCPNLCELPNLHLLELQPETLSRISLNLKQPVITDKVVESLYVNGLLKLKGCKCESLKGFENLSYENISLSSCESLRSISLGSCVSELEINSCSQLETLNFIQPSLTTLNLKNCDTLTDCNFPSTLQYLRIDCCNELYEVEVCDAISLTRMDISNCPHLKCILSPTSLVFLSVNCCDNLIEITRMHESQMTECFISDCDCLESLKPPTSITKLTVQNCYSLTTIENLKELTNLPRDTISALKRSLVFDK
ncbi:Leucine-rich repeat containing protein [Entamoeba marina]